MNERICIKKILTFFFYLKAIKDFKRKKRVSFILFQFCIIGIKEERKIIFSVFICLEDDEIFFNFIFRKNLLENNVFIPDMRRGKSLDLNKSSRTLTVV